MRKIIIELSLSDYEEEVYEGDSNEMVVADLVEEILCDYVVKETIK